MATLSEIARQYTRLQSGHVDHLQRLLAEWNMLADFCFADLLLFAPTEDEGKFVVMAQVRPLTSQTLYVTDWVGQQVSEAQRPVLSVAWRAGTLAEGDLHIDSTPERVQVLAMPVRNKGERVAVLTREWAPSKARQPGELERIYLDIFGRLVRMIVAGDFPFPAEHRLTSAAPQVGDGVVVLDANARVEYASPNAVSAMHRLGINANVAGLRLAELGFDDGAARKAFETQLPVTEEIEQTGEVTIITRCIPLLADGKVTGGVMLVKDVSELRQRDRMLLSKDATIREIHHRVKNNLQTISSLLRLQGRRLTNPEAKAAVAESVRRIRTIAFVHETLSHEVGDDVAFIEILRPLTRMAEESLQSPDRPVRFRVVGNAGKLPAAIATPLAVVLTELLQNAVDHAFPHAEDDSGPHPSGQQLPAGSVTVDLVNDGAMLEVTVVDDGVGLQTDFDLSKVTGLGLSIVRTLVTTELAGTIVMRQGSAKDLAAVGVEPTAISGPGTVVELRIPLRPDTR